MFAVPSETLHTGLPVNFYIRKVIFWIIQTLLIVVTSHSSVQRQHTFYNLNNINLLAPELFFLILAHPVYKM